MLSCDFQTKFYNVLTKFWGEFHLLIWKCNKDFSIFKGDEIKRFVVNCPAVANILRENLEMTDEITSVCRALDLWYEIERFLKISKVGSKNKDEYPTMINQFVSHVSEFYECGANTFLTQKEIGDSETFYLHVLRYYLPKIAHTTWEKHSVGIGVFTMQGFERRNKESKNTLRRFNNNKGNIVVANMKRLWDLFYYEHSSM